MSLEYKNEENLAEEAKSLQNKIEKSSEEINKKLCKDFLENINKIIPELMRDFHRIYNTDDIEITFNSKRNINDQIRAIEQWKSQTITSLHSIWMAVDIIIKINWVIQSEWTKENPVTEATRAPYQMIWYYVLQKWYFWGYREDAGHIWFVENMPTLLEKYPSFAKSYDIYRIYNYLTKQNIIDIKYKKFIELYEKINNFKNKKIMKYDDSKKEVIRWRLKPINPKTYKIK